MNRLVSSAHSLNTSWNITTAQPIQQALLSSGIGQGRTGTWRSRLTSASLRTALVRRKTCSGSGPRFSTTRETIPACWGRLTLWCLSLFALFPNPYPKDVKMGRRRTHLSRKSYSSPHWLSWDWLKEMSREKGWASENILHWWFLFKPDIHQSCLEMEVYSYVPFPWHWNLPPSESLGDVSLSLDSEQGWQ